MSVSLHLVREVFQDASISMLMSLADSQSPWVKEQIYVKASSPIQHISAMDEATMRAFCGLDLTPSLFQKIVSSVLQKVLMEDDGFRQTATGKALLVQKERENTQSNSDDNDSSLPSDFVQVWQTKSTEKGPTAKKDRLFDVLSEAVEQQRSRELKSDVGSSPSSDEVSVQIDDVEKETMDEFGPYKSELDYLEDQISLMNKEASLIYVKRKMNESADDEPVVDEDEEYWRPRRASKDDPHREIKRRKDSEQLERTIQQLRDKIGNKLVASRRESGHKFRLEELCVALELKQFEKFCILELAKSVIMPREERRYGRMIMEGGRAAPIGYLIERFSDSLEEKMKARSFFYKSSTLIQEGILTISQHDFMSDLTSCRVELDRRLFDYIVGLDTEMSEVVEGSHLYLPDVNLDDVVLPTETKQRVVNAILNFDKVKRTYNELQIDRKITYGLGQVFLFHGASGTGKTMLANAMASKLQKKILLVNFPDLGSNSSGAIIKFLFREARINRALLFFDECEKLFLDRGKGGQSVTMILSELERFDGLCILATNRAHDLDEAMHRRISLAVEFRKPDHILREEIWKTLMPPEVPLDRDEVDFGLLARKYELTGGLIKNVWLQSISLMVQRGGNKITADDLMQAASEQVIGQLSGEDFDCRVIPTCGLESMVLSPDLTDSLNSIVHHTKAQAVLHGQWGCDKIHRSSMGISALFTGLPGTGKTMAAEAIGFELGRPLLVVNVAELVSKWVGDTAKNIKAVFVDAKKRDAILVFDEGEALFSRRCGDTSSSTARHDTMNVALLLQSIEQFPGVCIVITNQKHIIDEAFFRRFRLVLDFGKPDIAAREKMWKMLVPKDTPLSSDVSFSDLAARFELCGGDMKNAFLCAATQAALRPTAANRILTTDDLVRACQAEQRKLERCTAGSALDMYS